MTGLVRGWVSGYTRNHGVALAWVRDRAVDDGQYTRFQVLASEHRQTQHTPKLEIQVRP